jgi:IS4 transposase
MTMLKALVTDQSFINQHKEGQKSFSRVKKLDFPTMFFFVLSLIKLNLDFDSEQFFGRLGINVVPSAVTQRRAQIRYTAFEEALEFAALHLPQSLTVKGYRVLAVDGIHGELPRQPELIEAYGLVGASSYPQFHAVAFCDILNDFFVCASWNKHPADERSAALKLLKEKKFPEKSIFLFDRGFPGIELFKQLNDKGYKFLMRIQALAFKEVMAFADSCNRDEIVTITYDKKRANWNKHKTMDIKLPYTCMLRCVRIDLPSGEAEILITNLSREEFSVDEIGDLYYLRWNIETNFNHLKNAIHIETFIGVKNNSIKQEFFGCLLKYSLAKQAEFEAQDEYDSKKKRIRNWNIR